MSDLYSTQAGRSCLHWAARCEYPEMREEMEELLVSKGADKNAKDNVSIHLLGYRSQ